MVHMRHLKQNKHLNLNNQQSHNHIQGSIHSRSQISHQQNKNNNHHHTKHHLQSFLQSHQQYHLQDQPAPKDVGVSDKKAQQATPTDKSVKTQTSQISKSTQDKNTNTTQTNNKPEQTKSPQAGNSTKQKTPLSVDASAGSTNSTQSAKEGQTKSQISDSSTAAVGNGLIFGFIAAETLIKIGVVLAVVLIIYIIILCIVRRKKTLKDYNQSPQIFAHKPDLSKSQTINLQLTKFLPVLGDPKNILINKNIKDYAGAFFNIKFQGKQKNAVIYDRLQNTRCYFEVQILHITGPLQIGFLPVKQLQNYKLGQTPLNTIGLSVNNTGFVMSEGQNIYNYGWKLSYGDVIGVGLTPQSSKFDQRRAWISRNGQLLNKPPADQLQKWIASINISAQQKQVYNLGQQKKQDEDQQVTEDKKTPQQLRKQKEQAQLKKQVISMKTMEKFQFYPIIFFSGIKSPERPTIINVNVGGQVFRMNDQLYRSGLLRQKPFFGDN